MKITKMHLFRAGTLMLLVGLTALYQNCGNVSLMAARQGTLESKACADQDVDLLILPTSNVAIAPATAFRVYQRNENGGIEEFIPQDPGTSWIWLRDHQQVRSEEVVSLGQGRTELRTEIDLQTCSSQGAHISARVQVCGEELPLISETYLPEECPEETSTTTTTTVPPQPPTSIPGWTNGPAERCDSDSNTNNEPEPPVPYQCVDKIPTLAQAYVDLPGTPSPGQAPLADSRAFRNLSQTYLHTGYCRNSDGGSVRAWNGINEFYSMRFVAQSNEISSASIVTNAVITVTISECPGDFGAVQENWPRVNSVNGRVRTLHYHSENIHKARNEKGYRTYGFARNDYCTWSGSDTNMPTVLWATGSRVNAMSCNLIPGKTYYMNLVMRRSDNNMPSANADLPGRNFKITVDRSCPDNPGNSCPGIGVP